MMVNKGLSPKSMGLIYMYDNTSNFGLNSVASLEKSIQDVYGSQILNYADKRIERRSQYYSIPLKYQGGLLVVAKSPEPVYQSNGPILYATLKELECYYSYEDALNLLEVWAVKVSNDYLIHKQQQAKYNMQR